MGISFRTRKYGSDIDASFYLSDGQTATSPQWHIGDTVSVIFSVTKEQADVIRDYNMYLHTFDDYVHVQCVVVERDHCIAWKSVGKFQEVSSHFKLEAKSGDWEDVLLWVIKDIRPEWAPTILGE